MFRYTFDTMATPDQVFAVLTDFTDRRLETWKGSLDPKKYELREQGDTWAVCKEGSAPLNIWVVLRYEWELPGTIRWSMVESNHCGRGDGLVTIRPASGNGSRVSIEIDHGEPWGLRGRAILGMQELLGPRLFPGMWKRSLDRYAAAHPGVT
jgi:Polyketide cyclase / dehydrase and lipid transport